MKSEQSKEISQAKQAIWPDGLKNHETKSHGGVDSELPAEDLPTLPNEDLDDTYMDGSDEPDGSEPEDESASKYER